MPSRLRADEALQHHEVVGRAQNIPAVVQRQLELARREFGDDRLDGHPLRFRRGVDVGEERLHAVQVIDGIDLRLVRPPTVRQGGGGLEGVARRRARVEQKEF
jgi:hypothetical protein